MNSPVILSQNFLFGLPADNSLPQSACLRAVEAHRFPLECLPCSPERVSPAPPEDLLVRDCCPLDYFHLHFSVPHFLVDRFRSLHSMASLEGMRMAYFTPRSSSAPLGLLFPGDPGVGRGMVSADSNNFAPRLGPHWQWQEFGTRHLRRFLRGHLRQFLEPGGGPQPFSARRQFSNGPFSGQPIRRYGRQTVPICIQSDQPAVRSASSAGSSAARSPMGSTT